MKIIKKVSMKNIAIVFVAALISLSACENKQKQSEQAEADSITKASKISGVVPKMDFAKKDTVNLGTVKAGEKVTHTFRFTNVGGAPLQISNCSASCGCTVPTWPQKAVMPGDTGSVTIVFDSKNKEGKLFKNVTIEANTQPSSTVVGFNIEVLK
jgi:hypothetical protein